MSVSGSQRYRYTSPFTGPLGPSRDRVRFVRKNIIHLNVRRFKLNWKILKNKYIYIFMLCIIPATGLLVL